MRLSPRIVVLPLLFGLLTAPLTATTVRQFNLAELTSRAQKIYVGTVRSATEGTTVVGGGQVAVVTYQLAVEEDLRGETAMVKGVRVAEIRMLGKQPPVRRGSLRRVSPIPEMPVLAVNQTYLVFTTAPSSAGLSTTVGLGQGSFKVYGKGADQMAVNEINNAGLFRDMVLPAPSIAAARASSPQAGGPIPFAALRAQIISLVGSR
jgi:hypothetical protein